MDDPSQLEIAVVQQLEQYFRDLDGAPPRLIYEMVIRSVEGPMLKTVMGHAQGKQSQASQMLGINRNTLRKLLKQHGILSSTQSHHQKTE